MLKNQSRTLERERERKKERKKRKEIKDGKNEKDVLIDYRYRKREKEEEFSRWTGSYGIILREKSKIWGKRRSNDWWLHH